MRVYSLFYMEIMRGFVRTGRYVNNATSVEVWTVMAYICAMQAISLNVEVGYAGGSYEISN